jgi:hypothetical protein
MEVRIDRKDGKPVAPPSQLLDQIASQLQVEQQAWLRQLTDKPSSFAELEVSVHHTFQHLASQLVASLLAQASQQSPTLEAAKKK